MKHTIRVGKGFGKKRLDQAISMAESGDTILIESGEYNFLNGFKIIKNLIIRGIGDKPEDVILHTSFYPRNNINFELDHVLVQPINDSNCMSVHEHSNVFSSNTIYKSAKSDNYPSIYVKEGSSVKLVSCSIYSNSSEAYALYGEEKCVVGIERCIVDEIKVDDSKLNISNSQIRFFIYAVNNSIVESSDYVQFLNNDINKVSICAENNSIIRLNSIEGNKNDLEGKLIDSLLEVKNIELNDNVIFKVVYNDQSTAEVDENKVELVNSDELLRQQESAFLEESKQKQQVNKEIENDTNNSDISEEVNEIEEENTVQVNEKDSLEELNDLYGLSTVKEKIKGFIDTARFSKLREKQGLSAAPINLHSLFVGNPGTGKTTVARLLGKILYENNVIPTDKFKEVSRKDLVSDVIGGTAKNTQQALEDAKGGILFIDEAYSLYSKSDQDFGKEAIDTILKYMEDNREDLMIIFAGYSDKMQDFLNINQGLKSRIPNVFDFEDYTPNEVAEIGYSYLINSQYNVYKKKYVDVVISQYSHAVDHSNARWVRNFNDKLLTIVSKRIVSEGSNDLRTITQKDLDELTGGNQEDKKANINTLLNELNDLTGLDNVKKEITSIIKEAQVDKKLAVKGFAPKTYHMVFEGNPGTGKTTVAQIIAKLFYNLDILPSKTIVTADRSTLVGQYIGHTEANTKRAIDEAMGGVLFIDEAYQLSDTGYDRDFGKLAIETLITALENYRDKFIVIFAGYTDNMEKFLDSNPGLRSRINTKIVFPDYSEDDIATMVEKRLEKTWSFDRKVLRSVVKKTFEDESLKDRQSNGRWARNFSEKVDRKQKIYLIDNDISDNQLRILPESVLQSVYQDYHNLQNGE